jgi:hypothetical protein
MVDSPGKGKSADLGKRYTITGEYYIIHAFSLKPSGGLFTIYNAAM